MDQLVADCVAKAKNCDGAPVPFIAWVINAERYTTVPAALSPHAVAEADRFAYVVRYRLLRLEHAHRSAVENHVHRAPQWGSRRSLNLRTPNIRAQDANNDVTLGKSGVVATSRGGAAT
jgi:hypothetical protein